MSDIANKFFDKLKNSDHPWGNFLYARARVIDWMRNEMNWSNAEIAHCLYMDEMQIKLILMQWDDANGRHN